jgi:hypothetical protein
MASLQAKNAHFVTKAQPLGRPFAPFPPGVGPLLAAPGGTGLISALAMRAGPGRIGVSPDGQVAGGTPRLSSFHLFPFQIHR